MEKSIFGELSLSSASLTSSLSKMITRARLDGVTRSMERQKEAIKRAAKFCSPRQISHSQESVADFEKKFSDSHTFENQMGYSFAYYSFAEQLKEQRAAAKELRADMGSYKDTVRKWHDLLQQLKAA